MSDGSAEKENPVHKEKPLDWKIIVGAMVILAAVAFITTSSMSSTVFSFQVHELDAQPDSLLGQTIRVEGHIIDDSYRVREGTLDEHLFLLGTEQSTVTVQYRGALPDQFQEGQRLMATGELVDRQFLRADDLTMQCASRYENEPPAWIDVDASTFSQALGE